MLELYDLEHSDINAAVTDNAANMRATFRNEIHEIENYFCVAHTLQLMIKNCINNSKEVVEMLKKNSTNCFIF